MEASPNNRSKLVGQKKQEKQEYGAKKETRTKVKAAKARAGRTHHSSPEKPTNRWGQG